MRGYRRKNRAHIRMVEVGKLELILSYIIQVLEIKFHCTLNNGINLTSNCPTHCNCFKVILAIPFAFKN